MEKISAQSRHVGASSPKGEERVVEILNAAREVLIDKGYAGLSMRKIAQRAGISIGNLSYYYKTKEAILHDLIDAVVEAYFEVWADIIQEDGKSDSEKLHKILEQVVLDLGERHTTHFFPELWALANHDEHAAKNVSHMYERAWEIIGDLIGRINPSLTAENRRLVTMFIGTSIEGFTPFIGYKKPFAEDRKVFAGFAPKVFVGLVERVTNEDIGGQVIQMTAAK